MLGSRTLSSVVTLLVGLATVFALALPEGNGGRDSVVRLTRGGLHRIGCPDTAGAAHDDAQACLESFSQLTPQPARTDGPSAAAVVTAATRVPVPAWHPAPPQSALPAARHPVPPSHPVSGRAPPAR